MTVTMSFHLAVLLGMVTSINGHCPGPPHV